MPRRLLSRLCVVARLVVALGCFQMSGYGHLVTDLLVTFGIVSEHCDDCSDEDDGRDCPPGCPTCHCVHCVTPALPAGARSALLDIAGIDRAMPLNDAGRAPSPPELPSVYRPPRTLPSRG